MLGTVHLWVLLAMGCNPGNHGESPALREIRGLASQKGRWRLRLEGGSEKAWRSPRLVKCAEAIRAVRMAKDAKDG